MEGLKRAIILLPFGVSTTRITSMLNITMEQPVSKVGKKA